MSTKTTRARVRNVSSDMQEKMLALNSLVTGAMQSPEEIQTMEAEPIFSEKHDAQLEALLRARLKTTLIYSLLQRDYKRVRVALIEDRLDIGQLPIRYALAVDGSSTFNMSGTIT